MRSHASAPHARFRHVRSAVASSFLLSLLLLAVTSAPASAVLSHPFLKAISTGAGSRPGALAIDAAGNVYVTDQGTGQGIEKFDPDGNPINFSASASYIAGNKLTGTPTDTFPGSDCCSLGLSQGLAVDRSGGPTNGYIYATSYLALKEAGPYPNGGGIFAFDASGTYKGFIPAGVMPVGGEYGYACGLGIKPATGELYLGSVNIEGVTRYTPADSNPANDAITGRLNVGLGCATAVDTTGAIYFTKAGGGVWKYAESQLGEPSPSGTEVDPTEASALAADPATDNVLVDRRDRVVEYTSAGSQVAEISGISESTGVAADGGKVFISEPSGSILVFGPLAPMPIIKTGGTSDPFPEATTLNGEVDPDSAGNVTGCEFKYGSDQSYSAGSVPCAEALPITGPTQVSARLENLDLLSTYHYRLFVESANGVQRGDDQTFTTSPPVEGVATGDATEVTKETATLNGSFIGRGEDHHYYFEYGTDTSYGQTAPAPPGNDAGSAKGQQNVVPVPISRLQSATEYHYRIVMTNLYGETKGEDRTFTTAPSVTNLTTDPATGITNAEADLHGSFDADKYAVQYYFEYGPTGDYGSTAPVPPGEEVAPGSGRVNLAVHIGGLQAGATYHYRIVATNALGKTVGQDTVFKVAEAPLIGNLSTSEVTATSARLQAEINPSGGDTSYRFEWGTTTSYGSSIPIPAAGIGSGREMVPVHAQLEALTSGTTYHFRVVAENPYGTTVSPDQTFGFYPPPCPNAQVRQETSSNHLPDCRGYEIASAAYAGGTNLFPQEGPSAPYATSPSRIAYAGAYSNTIPGVGEGTNSVSDLYVATRTDTGWYTKYIGRPGSEALEMGGPPLNHLLSLTGQTFTRSQFGVQASPGMDRILDYDLGYPGFYDAFGKPSNAPYVWNASTGSLSERWPTNLSQVSGGEFFIGRPRASTDFTHFVFSSHLVFAPGGEEVEPTPFEGRFFEVHCCNAPIYDNNVKTGEVTHVSTKENGDNFQGEILHISDDGSHILMAEGEDALERCYYDGTCNPIVDRPLFLSINHRAYDIAPGRQVRYAGSTADGSTIYLTSGEQLTSDDHDSSLDLFMWQEDEPNSLTRISVGSGGLTGDSDQCSVSWTVKCGVVLLKPNRQYEMGGSNLQPGQGGNGVTDSPIAANNGDIYFESPEQLDGAKGEPGAVNLYVYRNGSVRYVTQMSWSPWCLAGICSDGPIARIQISRSGERAAFVTASRVTSYDNGGYAEMYTFAPGTGRIACVSCRTDGHPPVSDVLASQNGLFLTDDGRAFFSTVDPLQSRDTNEARDVYEYTEGKAQLISSGLGEEIAPSSGMGSATSLSQPGLVGVSANGTDAYFSTYDNLVTQDHNGRELKIYDARTGGGFPAELPAPRCEAADECHGSTSGPPALPSDRTSAQLGKAGKRHVVRKKHKAKHSKKKRRTRHAKKVTKPKSRDAKRGGHKNG